MTLEGSVYVETSIDRTATRKALRAYFELYRHRKLLLEMDMIPHAPADDAADGMDPDLIRATHVYGEPPTVRDRDSMLTPLDRYREAFVDKTERMVARLPQYQREMITYQYMQPERPGTESRIPSDTETYLYLRAHGWYVSERYYDAEKSKAILTLSQAFRIVVYVD